MKCAIDSFTTQGMFDVNRNGTIDFNEFCSLWQYVTDWTNTFRNYDLDGNGTIDHRELSQGNPSSRSYNYLRINFLQV